MSIGKLIEDHVAVYAEDGTEIKLNHLISDTGGQGDVYHVTYKGEDYALKWYCKSPDDVIGGDQYNTIRKLTKLGEPSPEFIWPLFLVTEKDPAAGKNFGYLMHLLPDGFRDLDDFLRMDSDPKAVRFSTYNAQLVAAMNIAARMQKLHLRGLSYKDLNPKNFSIHPETGAVLVVDNDNVSVDGAPCTVKGMKGYMAPEIPRTNYRMNPSITTDYYSLAVVLYRLFFNDHPMEGRLWEKYPLCNDKVEDYMYAIKPVFHFDPNDDSNRPTDAYAPNAESRWVVQPVSLRQEFITAFTEGIDTPNKRPPENEWITVIAKTRDKLIRKPDGQEQFVNFDNPEHIPAGCLGMKLNNNRIALYPGKAMYEVSVTGKAQQYGALVGGIVWVKEKRVMMLRNLSDQVWQCTRPDGSQTDTIGRNQQYPLVPGVKINFRTSGLKIVGEVFDPKSQK